MRRIAVLDIGKTNAKVLVVDLHTGAEEVLARTPNVVVRDAPCPHHDLDLRDGPVKGHPALASPFMHHYLFLALQRLGRRSGIHAIIAARWGRWVPEGRPITPENWSIASPTALPATAIRCTRRTGPRSPGSRRSARSAG
ncbi:MAG: hypothetical protein ACK4GM_07975 [Tabrizicola sp.]